MKISTTATKLFFIALSLTSCSSVRFLESESILAVESLINDSESYEYQLESDDRITVSVWGHDDLSVGSIYNIYNSNEAFGKWIGIDATGKAKFPGVGILQISGMTATQVEDTLTSVFSKTLVNPLVEVKILNREVSVVGEVRTAGSFKIEEEQVSLMHMIGLAQGFTKYANLNKVQLTRNNETVVLNLTKISDSDLQSIKLRDEDILFIPTRKTKVIQEQSAIIIPFASALTSVALVYSVLK